MMEIINTLGLEDHIDKIALYVLATRAFFKPACSFYIKYVSPYINIEFTDRALKNPIYKAITYLLDYTSSIKLPQEKK